MDNEINTQTTSSASSHIAALEAILFLYGEPVSRDMIMRLLQVSSEQVSEIIRAFQETLMDSQRGLLLLEKGDAYMLITKPQFAPFLESFVKDSLKEELTPSAVETLSLVAYFGPITRAQIDYIRGVNSSFMLRNLLVRGLVERTSKGNTYLYEVTTDFLTHLGLARLEDLPQYGQYQETRKNFFESDETASIPVTIDSEKKVDDHLDTSCI
ncbi:MAG: SMC-Scp complex subunit ScpB [Candidatus Paceibacterota bacterium]